VARLLIEKGADVNARDNNGSTPLIAAAFKGRSGIAQLLIDKGADVKAADPTASRPPNTPRRRARRHRRDDRGLAGRGECRARAPRAREGAAGGGGAHAEEAKRRLKPSRESSGSALFKIWLGAGGWF